jgi:hypothetical protein
MALPENAILIADLVKAWPDAVPPLRDSGDAALLNRVMGNLLDAFHKAGKTVPNMVYVTDAPPGIDRAVLLAGQAQVDPMWFAAAFGRWTNSPLFLKFWDSLTPEQQQAYFALVPR